MGVRSHGKKEEESRSDPQRGWPTVVDSEWLLRFVRPGNLSSWWWNWSFVFRRRRAREGRHPLLLLPHLPPHRLRVIFWLRHNLPGQQAVAVQLSI